MFDTFEGVLLWMCIVICSFTCAVLSLGYNEMIAAGISAAIFCFAICYALVAVYKEGS